MTLHRVLTDEENLSYLFYCFYREPSTCKNLKLRAPKVQGGPWIPPAWKQFPVAAKIVLRQLFRIASPDLLGISPFHQVTFGSGPLTTRRTSPSLS